MVSWAKQFKWEGYTLRRDCVPSKMDKMCTSTWMLKPLSFQIPYHYPGQLHSGICQITVGSNKMQIVDNNSQFHSHEQWWVGQSNQHGIRPTFTSTSVG